MGKGNFRLNDHWDKVSTSQPYGDVIGIKQTAHI